METNRSLARGAGLGGLFRGLQVSRAPCWPPGPQPGTGCGSESESRGSPAALARGSSPADRGETKRRRREGTSELGPRHVKERPLSCSPEAPSGEWVRVGTWSANRDAAHPPATPRPRLPALLDPGSKGAGRDRLALWNSAAAAGGVGVGGGGHGSLF